MKTTIKTKVIKTLIRNLLLAEGKLIYTSKENATLIHVVSAIDDLLTCRSNSKGFKNAVYNLQQRTRRQHEIANSDELLNS